MQLNCRCKGMRGSISKQTETAAGGGLQLNDSACLAMRGRKAPPGAAKTRSESHNNEWGHGREGSHALRRGDVPGGLTNRPAQSASSAGSARWHRRCRRAAISRARPVSVGRRSAEASEPGQGPSPPAAPRGQASAPPPPGAASGRGKDPGRIQDQGDTMAPAPPFWIVPQLASQLPDEPGSPSGTEHSGAVRPASPGGRSAGGAGGIGGPRGGRSRGSADGGGWHPRPQLTEAPRACMAAAAGTEAGTRLHFRFQPSPPPAAVSHRPAARAQARGAGSPPRGPPPAARAPGLPPPRA